MCYHFLDALGPERSGFLCNEQGATGYVERPLRPSNQSGHPLVSD
jgi:hypothetical protein